MITIGNWGLKGRGNGGSRRASDSAALDTLLEVKNVGEYARMTEIVKMVDMKRCVRRYDDMAEIGEILLI
jgi:predicted metalloprotease